MRNKLITIGGSFGGGGERENGVFCKTTFLLDKTANVLAKLGLMMFCPGKAAYLSNWFGFIN